MDTLKHRAGVERGPRGFVVRIVVGGFRDRADATAWAAEFNGCGRLVFADPANDNRAPGAAREDE